MRAVILAMSLATLAGCALNVPTKSPKFPDAPAELTEKLPDLIPLEPGKKKPKELLDNAAENYGICYQYLERSLAWQNWYQEQRALHQKHQK